MSYQYPMIDHCSQVFGIFKRESHYDGVIFNGPHRAKVDVGEHPFFIGPSICTEGCVFLTKEELIQLGREIISFAEEQ